MKLHEIRNTRTVYSLRENLNMQKYTKRRKLTKRIKEFSLY